MLLRLVRADGQTKPRRRRSNVNNQEYIGPHTFQRMGFFRRFECQYCYLTKDAHPVKFWAPERTR